jgi:micrococcal nuclease
MFVMTGCSAPAQTPVAKPAETQAVKQPLVQGRWGTVAKVLDGDTLALDSGEKVRMIGVNTPETVKSGSPVQPFGEEASQYTKSQLEGKKVYLETDAEEKDSYGRTLAYVYVAEPQAPDEISQNMFNAMLLRGGYAQLMTIKPNVKYQTLFQDLQKNAHAQNKGLWALGVYKDSATSTNDVFLPGKDPAAKETAAAKAPAEPAATPAPPAAAPAKPAPQPAPQPSPAPPSSISYKNCDAVRAAGKAPLHRGDPGYAPKLDRDNDGIACE